MHLILLMVLVVMIAVVSAQVLRRRREHRIAELAKARRYEQWKTRRQNIPNVSANLCGSSPEPTAPISRPPPLRAA
jgi:septation ring formation regulator EzrA